MSELKKQFPSSNPGISWRLPNAWLMLAALILPGVLAALSGSIGFIILLLPLLLGTTCGFYLFGTNRQKPVRRLTLYCAAAGFACAVASYGILFSGCAIPEGDRLFAPTTVGNYPGKLEDEGEE